MMVRKEIIANSNLNFKKVINVFLAQKSKLFKVNDRNTGKRYKICSKYAHDVVPVFLLLTLNISHTFC